RTLRAPRRASLPLTGSVVAPNRLCTAVLPPKVASARFRGHCPASGRLASSAIFQAAAKERPDPTFVERGGGSSKAGGLSGNFHTWVAISHELPKGAPLACRAPSLED